MKRHPDQSSKLSSTRRKILPGDSLVQLHDIKPPYFTQVVNWLEISDRAEFGAHSRTGIEFLGSNYNGILQSTLASNCTPISSELSKLVHSKTWHFTLTQPLPRDFWLPVFCNVQTHTLRTLSGERCRESELLTLVGSSIAILTPSWRVGTEKASVGREVSQSRKSWLVWSWERSSHRYLVVDGYKIAWSTVPRKFYLIQFHFWFLCMYKAKTRLSAYIKSNYTYTNLSPFFSIFST